MCYYTDKAILPTRGGFGPEWGGGEGSRLTTWLQQSKRMPRYREFRQGRITCGQHAPVVRIGIRAFVYAHGCKVSLTHSETDTHKKIGYTQCFFDSQPKFWLMFIIKKVLNVMSHDLDLH